MASPGNRLRFDLTPQDVTSMADELMTKSKAVYDVIASVKPEEANYDNVIKVNFIGNVMAELSQ